MNLNQYLPQGYILRIPAPRVDLFIENEQSYYAEPVSDFQLRKTGAPLIVFILTEDESISHIANGKPGVRAGTSLRRLNITNILQLKSPLMIDDILEHVPANLKKHILRRFEVGGIVPPESFKGLVASIVKLDQSSEKLLGRFSEVRESKIKQLSPKTVSALALQKEAIKSALYLADIDREPLLEWSPSTNKHQESFLDGLPQAYLREDQMIFNDLNNMPEFERIKGSITGVVSFENRTVRLDIILANRLRLEEQTGADLIYYNATYNSFILVQYKAMEEVSGSADSPLFRIPNSQLTEEIERMDKLLIKLKEMDAESGRGGYRLNTNPFFIKLCPRIVLEPDSVSLTPGMYFSLDHWKTLENDPELIGPKGGRLVNYRNVGRYLNNSDFASLIKGAWVGTTPSQSSILEEIVSTLLQEGKSVIIATKSQKELSFEDTLENDF